MLTIPGLCWLCRMPLAVAGWGICSICQQSLTPPPHCPRCGLEAITHPLPCGRCLLKPPPWQRLIYVDDYRAPLNVLVQRLKFSAATALAPALSRLLLCQLLAARRDGTLRLPDCIIAVPLHQTRGWRRGFNQSDLLARPLARWLGCRYQPGGLKRRRRTAIQHQLSASARSDNLRGAFTLEFPVRDLHIAIVDDVVTTGSTVAEISRLLLRNGAATVQVWCLCRTL
ncbi:DNA utilization protein GntX [Entomohabitans teleogrylli]|uniref:DNA utilization protein GntX n=1 Tax=Entomohabitans teleogrylli TaxID=1384589 RepID=UPI00073D54A8|nr:DNA utilization protein GntX [Entomohabitans teleogrylli]